MSTSIPALDRLSFDAVHKLACAANALGARHIRPIRRWPWSRGYVKGLMGCDVCHRNWVARTGTPAHADWCPVGRTQQMAQQIIAMGSQPLPKHLSATEVPAFTKRLDTPAPQPGLRIQEVPQHHPDERSGRTERRRGSGDSPAAAPAPSYGEPWAWDPQRLCVVDRHGFVMNDMVRGTDITVGELERVGRRIVICVNLLAGYASGGVVREAAGKAVVLPQECNGIVLDCDAEGWFVCERGGRLDFRGGYDDAKAYFDTRVHLARENARVRA